MTPIEPTGPDWRATRPGVGGSARRALPLILAVATVAAVALGVLVWVQPPRQPVFLAVNTSPDPFAVADFRLVSSLPGQAPPVALLAEPDRDRIRTAVAALRSVSARTPVVVFIGGAAEVDSEGGLQLAPTVRGADHARNRWPFAELLQTLAECKSTRKLLVLNLAAPTGDWVTPAIRALDAVPDTGRKVLFANGVGETSHGGLEWGGSAFAGYFAEGYRGAADGWNTGGKTDGRVTAEELAAFVRARVSRWAERNRAAPQTPWLFGDGADFELSTVLDAEPLLAVPTAYPQPLRDAWAVRDAWLADGRSTKSPAAFLALERVLLTMDRQWFGGMAPEVARANFDAALNLLDPAKVPPPERVPLVLKDLPPAEAAQVTAVMRYVARADAPPDPAEKPPAATASAVFTVATSDVAWTPAKWKRLATTLAVAEPEPGSFLALIVRRVGSTEDPVPPLLAGRLIRATAEFEAVARDADFFLLGRSALAEAEAEWRTAVALVFAPRYVSVADTTAALTRLEDAVRTLTFARSRFVAAVAELRAADRIPADAALTAARQQLREKLTPQAESLTEAANRWTTATADVAAARVAAAEAVQPAALARLHQRATSGTDGPATLDTLDRLLASPLLSAPDRASLWTDRLTLAAKLHDGVRSRDRREDDDTRAGRMTAAWKNPTERPPSQAVKASGGPLAFGQEKQALPREFLNWHAARFDEWTADPLDLPAFTPDAEFAAKAAEACRAFGAGPVARERLEWATTLDAVELTPGKRATTAEVRLRLLGSEKPLVSALLARSPAGEWVTGRLPADIELSPIRAVAANLDIAVGSAPERFMKLSGVLLSATVAGRPSFKRFAVNTDRLSNRLELLVKEGADGPELPATALRVRPNGKPAAFTFLLVNPTAVPQTVAVKLESPERVIATLTLEPKKSVPLVFPAPPPAVPAVPPPPMLPPPAAPIDAPESFRIQLLDVKTMTELQSFAVPVKVLEPSEALIVREAVFRGGGDGKPAELSVILAERESFRGGPMPVAMAFPTDRNPGLIVPDGKLSGALESGGAAVRLYATNPTFDRGKGGRVTLTTAADGVERAFVLTGDIGSDAGVVRLQPVTTPRVKVVTDDFATGLDPLPTRFEVENTPPGATLEIDIGLPAGADFKRDYRLDTRPPARKRTTTLAFDPKGPLSLAATITDTEVALPVDRLVGERVVRARVLDANGKEIAAATRRVIFDGDPPRNLKFIDPPARAKAAMPLAVRVTVDPPVSGVKEVNVFLGKPAKNAPPSGAMLIPAKPDGDGWTATVPLGAGPVPADITAQVVSGSGKTAFATTTVELVPAGEFDKPKPGAIAGKVVEGEIAQPGLVVELYDEKEKPKGNEKQKPKATAKTKDDGTFLFADLPAGQYRVFAAKVTTNREKGESVEVVAGETSGVTLALVLK